MIETGRVHTTRPEDMIVYTVTENPFANHQRVDLFGYQTETRRKNKLQGRRNDSRVSEIEVSLIMQIQALYLQLEIWSGVLVCAQDARLCNAQRKQVNMTFANSLE